MKTALLEQHTATEKRIELLDLDTIVTKGLQTRTGTNHAKVTEYAEIYRAGGQLPPIVVFSDGGDEFYLGDGHHRCLAARKAEQTEIAGIIRKGTRRDALWYATAANAEHGLPRTNEDKRKTVALILGDEEWRQLSDTQISAHAKVSDRLVAKVRKELGLDAPERKGKDGKVRAKPAPKAKAQAQPSTPNGSGLSAHGLTQHEIDQAYCCQILAEAKGTPKLRSVIVHPTNNQVFANTGGADLTALLDPQAFATRYPGAKVGRYVDLSNPATGYRGIKVTYRDEELVFAGRDLEFNPHSDPLPTEAITLTDTHRRILQSIESHRGKSSKERTSEAVGGRLGIPLVSHRELFRDLVWARLIEHHDDGAFLLTAAGRKAINAKTDVEVPPPAPPAGPEEVNLGEELPPAAPTPPAAHAPAPQQMDPPPAGRPLALRRLDQQRALVAVELLQGKPQWRGTDNDLWCLALICGFPTRSVAWIDAVRAQARDLAVDALRTEVAERVRSGEAANTPKWPTIRELCAVWGLDFASIEIRAERAVPE